ncbi:class II aldolase/adducin family protein [Thiotrichales bacterium 19S3-7]|nr:class II aldolase/adducin family protein [Thiotrichales bacterium 19S3-7]MCF6800620.1 class II aldolase/adducin family protein [Thiotrichales bacterium 19S3-11]
MKFYESSLEALKQTTIALGNMLFEKNYLAACDGNISFKFDNKIYITKSGSYLWGMEKNDFAIVSLDGEVIENTPSSELALHLRIYQQTNAQAVIHAHPVNAIALSVAKAELAYIPDNILSELAICAGVVPIVPFARPGSELIADAIMPYLAKSKNMILAKHGVLSYGDSLKEAFFGVNRIEHTCEVLVKALSIGQLSTISESDVKILWEIRQQVGHISR